jgi:predicted DCC family thiol-disulfide oxidoreductase YuxK
VDREDGPGEQEEEAVTPVSDIPLVLWDGDCSFCARCVRLAERLARGRFRFEPYQDAAIDADLRAACAAAVHVLLPDGRTERAGRACLLVAERLGAGVVARVLARPPMIWLIEAVYRLVARSRSCRI